MKTYTEQYLTKEKLSTINIQDIGWSVFTPLSNIKVELRNDFQDWELYSDIADGTMVCIWYTDIDYYCIDNTNWEYDATGRDEYMFEDYIDNLISDYDYYLVCAYNCTWDKRTGYKIVDEKRKIFDRNYDVSQYVIGSDVNGKILLLSELHHDCLTGHETFVVGLTEEDYHKLEDVNWETVIEFANQESKSLIRF